LFFFLFFSFFLCFFFHHAHNFMFDSLFLFSKICVIIFFLIFIYFYFLDILWAIWPFFFLSHAFSHNYFNINTCWFIFGHNS
jgi:hypothetical protein